MEPFLEHFWNFLFVLLLKTLKLSSYSMKIRKTFLISWLVSFNKKQTETSVIDVEHIQTGNRQRVSTLEEASIWMSKAGKPDKHFQTDEKK